MPATSGGLPYPSHPQLKGDMIELSMPGVRRSVANVGYPRATVIYVRQAQGPLAASLQGPGSWLQL